MRRASSSFFTEISVLTCWARTERRALSSTFKNWVLTKPLHEPAMQTLRNWVWRKNIGDEGCDSDILLDGGSFEDELCRRAQRTHSLALTFGRKSPLLASLALRSCQ